MKQCKKMHFISKEDAKAFILKVRRANSCKGKLFPYKCSRCQYWHTTRQTKKQQRLNFKRAGM